LSQGILLDNLVANCQNLLDTGQLFRGHTTFHHVYNARGQIQLRDTVLRYVSAYGLTSLLAPTSLQAHGKMAEKDKMIWGEAYN